MVLVETTDRLGDGVHSQYLQLQRLWHVMHRRRGARPMQVGAVLNGIRVACIERKQKLEEKVDALFRWSALLEVDPGSSFTRVKWVI